MRPARKGPENVVTWMGMCLSSPASMRPARKGPENRPSAGVGASAEQASMRPARKGPENSDYLAPRHEGRPRFNEAGPQGTGKFVEQAQRHLGAGAASMRPARKGPENALRDEAAVPLGVASMRPARKGPENFGRTSRDTIALQRLQ